MIIGITGNIGSGKSTVGKYLRELGYEVLDADQISRQLYEIGTNCYFKIVEYFTDAILDEQKRINRIKLGEIIFADYSKKEFLESIVHEEILNELKRKSAISLKNIIFWEVPLLYEVGWDKEVDCVIYLSSNENDLITRVSQRDNLKEADIRRRLGNQINATNKLRDNDFLIINDGSITDLRKKVDDILVHINYCFNK